MTIKKQFIIFFLVILFIFCFPLMLQAEGEVVGGGATDKDALGETSEKLNEVFGTGGANVPQTDLIKVISNIIKWVLGFMGLVLTLMIIYGGFLWMSSGGDTEKISKAKNTITNGIIGLVIVVLAYTIANFVIKALGTEILIEPETPLKSQEIMDTPPTPPIK
jgi:hypothetical protein